MSKLTPKDAWSQNQKDESRKMKVQSYQNLRNNEINSIIKELKAEPSSQQQEQKQEQEQEQTQPKSVWYKPWTWFKVKR